MKTALVFSTISGFASPQEEQENREYYQMLKERKALAHRARQPKMLSYVLGRRVYLTKEEIEILNSKVE